MSILDRLDKWAGHRFVHDPIGDPVGPPWIMAFLSYVIGTVFLIRALPTLWPLFVYSWIVGVLMAFFSIRSQRRRMRGIGP